MESGDELETDNPSAAAAHTAAEAADVDDENGSKSDENDGEEDEEEEDEDEIDEIEEEQEKTQAIVSFDGVMNPLDLVESNPDEQVQLYQHFERIEYVLDEKKRKRADDDDHHQGQELVQRPRRTIGATLEEVAEVMSLCDRKRRKKAKKKGRRKGSRNNLNPEITKKLGEAHLQYVRDNYEDAISLLKEVVWLAPNLPDPYETLGLIYDAKGDKKKATEFRMIAAFLSPKNTYRWKRLVTCSIEQGNIGQAWYCLSKAIAADPADVTLLYRQASFCLEAGDFLKAAESYKQIVEVSRDNVEALKKATQLYNQCGRYESSISILEKYLIYHPTDADLSMVDLLASSYMDRKDFTKALHHIEHAEELCVSGDFPSYLTIRKGICYLYLADVEKAEICFRLLEREKAKHQADLIIAVANSFAELQQYESALKYYLMLEGCSSYNGNISLKIANCYSALKEAASAIQFFYKALGAQEDDVDTRLTLASLLFEENREEEAIKLLSPPQNSEISEGEDANNSEQWWHKVQVKVKLSQLYKSRGMVEAFVEVVYPLVHESLKIDSMHQKAKQRRRLSRSELLERVKVLGDHQTDSVFGHFRRPASKNELVKATRARRKLLEKRGSSKEEKTSAEMDTGFEWESDDSEDEIPQQPVKAPPWPDFFKDEENFNLIIDVEGLLSEHLKLMAYEKHISIYMNRALTSLRRYSDALELITLSLKITYKTLPIEKKEKFRSLGAEIAVNITDPSDGFDYVRYLVQQHPESKAAWNCYYKLVLRLENRLSKHHKFLHHMRVVHKDLVPPMIISGNQFTMISQHQVAAREYLEAYKQMPDHPLINLCAGTALINLALGLRLQNKHQCVAQGLAFLYNNLRICENSQESLYNLARACHHVGLVTLAASYYEKALAIRQEDLPFPAVVTDNDAMKSPKPGYSDLRREAAFNLHLIYKNSGASDLARQVLRNYCTF